MFSIDLVMLAENAWEQELHLNTSQNSYFVSNRVDELQIVHLNFVFCIRNSFWFCFSDFDLVSINQTIGSGYLAKSDIGLSEGGKNVIGRGYGSVHYENIGLEVKFGGRLGCYCGVESTIDFLQSFAWYYQFDVSIWDFGVMVWEKQMISRI